MSEPAITALTPRGLDLGRRLAGALGRAEVVPVRGDARPALQALFHAGRPLICIMPLGVVVRLLGPVLSDKQAEPPVVVVDEAGRFAVSVLGGHAGGGNALARRVAGALGAVPVVTTASDVLGLPAVDLIGRDRGWRVEDSACLTAVAAAVVRGDPVGVYQDAGCRDWWQEFGPWPEHFRRLETLPAPADLAALLVISDRLLPISGDKKAPVVVYRPATLVLGAGCKRGVPAAEIEALFGQVWAEHHLSPLSLAAVATVSLKADEPGLLEFAAGHGVPLRAFSPEELAGVGPLPTPSEQVRRRIGIAGVAEPAALMAAGADRLLVTKVRGARVTMAVARRAGA
jgi:cobalt-precorrin 5A hydrolase